MYKYIVILFAFCYATSSSGTATRQYRKDYVYNKITDSFYKLHIENLNYHRAKECCDVEGASLMLVRSDHDVVQAHSLYKKYPDIGMYFWVGADGKPHESAEEKPIIDLEESTESYYDKVGPNCEVLTRDTENIMSLACYITSPFICMVEASKVQYDPDCDVYSSGYKYNATVGSCYKIPKMAYTWSAAAVECEMEGAHLAVINSEAESEAIREVIKRAPSIIENARTSWFFSIGMRARKEKDASKERVFMTIFNQTLDQAGYNQWSDREPNNYLNSEYCGSVFKNDGKLNDVDCSHSYGFICEKEVQRHT